MQANATREDLIRALFRAKSLLVECDHLHRAYAQQCRRVSSLEAELSRARDAVDRCSVLEAALSLTEAKLQRTQQELNETQLELRKYRDKPQLSETLKTSKRPRSAAAADENVSSGAIALRAKRPKRHSSVAEINPRIAMQSRHPRRVDLDATSSDEESQRLSGVISTSETETVHRTVGISNESTRPKCSSLQQQALAHETVENDAEIPSPEKPTCKLDCTRSSSSNDLSDQSLVIVREVPARQSNDQPPVTRSKQSRLSLPAHSRATQIAKQRRKFRRVDLDATSSEDDDNARVDDQGCSSSTAVPNKSFSVKTRHRLATKRNADRVFNLKSFMKVLTIESTDRPVINAKNLASGEVILVQDAQGTTSEDAIVVQDAAGATSEDAIVVQDAQGATSDDAIVVQDAGGATCEDAADATSEDSIVVHDAEGSASGKSVEIKDAGDPTSEGLAIILDAEDTASDAPAIVQDETSEESAVVHDIEYTKSKGSVVVHDLEDTKSDGSAVEHDPEDTKSDGSAEVHDPEDTKSDRSAEVHDPEDTKSDGSAEVHDPEDTKSDGSPEVHDPEDTKSEGSDWSSVVHDAENATFERLAVVHNLEDAKSVRSDQFSLLHDAEDENSTVSKVVQNVEEPVVQEVLDGAPKQSFYVEKSNKTQSEQQLADNPKDSSSQLLSDNTDEESAELTYVEESKDAFAELVIDDNDEESSSKLIVSDSTKEVSSELIVVDDYTKQMSSELSDGGQISADSQTVCFSAQSEAKGPCSCSSRLDSTERHSSRVSTSESDDSNALPVGVAIAECAALSSLIEQASELQESADSSPEKFRISDTKLHEDDTLENLTIVDSEMSDKMPRLAHSVTKASDDWQSSASAATISEDFDDAPCSLAIVDFDDDTDRASIASSSTAAKRPSFLSPIRSPDPETIDYPVAPSAASVCRLKQCSFPIEEFVLDLNTSSAFRAVARRFADGWQLDPVMDWIFFLSHRMDMLEPLPAEPLSFRERVQAGMAIVLDNENGVLDNDELDALLRPDALAELCRGVQPAWIIDRLIPFLQRLLENTSGGDDGGVQHDSQLAALRRRCVACLMLVGPLSPESAARSAVRWINADNPPTGDTIIGQVKRFLKMRPALLRTLFATEKFPVCLLTA